LPDKEWVYLDKWTKLDRCPVTLYFPLLLVKRISGPAKPGLVKLNKFCECFQPKKAIYLYSFYLDRKIGRIAKQKLGGEHCLTFALYFVIHQVKGYKNKRDNYH